MTAKEQDSDSRATETSQEPCEEIRDLLGQAGWLLREPLDFGSKYDQNKIHDARSLVAKAHNRFMRMVKTAASPDEPPKDSAEPQELREALNVMTPAEHDACCEFLCDSTGEATEAEDCDCFLYQIKTARAAIQSLFAKQREEIAKAEAERDANYRAYEDGEQQITELEDELARQRETTLTPREARSYQICPVCVGTGRVMWPEGVAAGQGFTTSSSGPWPCRRCSGTGTIETPPASPSQSAPEERQ